MQIDNVREQLTDVISRAIKSGVSVRQNFPTFSNMGETQTIGDLGNTTIALKNVPYMDIYRELELNNQFHLKLPDGGLLIFQYIFDKEGLINKHRLCFFPSPILPTIDEAPELYAYDELYSEILLHRIVRFPIRFDFDPRNYKEKIHPHSHLTLGQFDNCRIPVCSPVSPIKFFRFIMRNFYNSLYIRHQNLFEKNVGGCHTPKLITASELSITHLVL